MKKQLFLIVLLAFFAGITSVNAQCVVGNGFSPSAGNTYMYRVAIAPGMGYDTLAGTFDWYVTQNVNLLDPGIIPATNVNFTVEPGGSSYNASGATENKLALKWTTAANGQTFYLVLKYTGNNTTVTPSCQAENIRVWQIKPNNTTNFLLAVYGADGNGNIFPNAYQCAEPIASAIVTPGTTPTVTYTYGTNTLLYRVVAKGTLGSWTPSIQIPALAALNGQKYAEVQWSNDMTGATGWTNFDLPTSPFGTSAGGQYSSAITASISDSANGTPILVKVSIVNTRYQTLADMPVQIGIDGMLPSGLSDIWGTGFSPNLECDQASPFAKTATYTIKARPTINAAIGTFITQVLP